MGPRDLLIVVSTVLDRIGADYFVTGSMAAMIYGEMRTTIDVDIIVDLRFGHVADLVEAFPEPEYSVSKAAVLQAMEHSSLFNVIMFRRRSRSTSS